MHFGLDLLQRLFEVGDRSRLFLLVSFKIPLSLSFFGRTRQVQSPLLVHLLLHCNFLPDLSITLLQTLNIRVQPAHVLVNEQILVLLLQEGFGDFLQVLNPTLLLDLLKVLVNQVHVLLVLVDDLYFFLVLSDQISESQLQDRLGVNAFGFGDLILVLLSVFLPASSVEVIFDHVDLLFVESH